MTDLVTATVTDDVITAILSEETMALTTATQARELLESKKAETAAQAQAALTPFFDTINEAVSNAIRKEKDTVTVSLESLPEPARPLAIAELEKAGYMYLTTDTLSAVKLKF